MRQHTITFDTVPIRANICVAGTNCFLSTNSRAVVDSVSRLHPLAEKMLSRSFEMGVLVDSSLTRGVEGNPQFRGMDHLVFAFFNDKETFTFDLRRSTVFGVVSPQTAADPYFWNELLLPIALGVLGTTIGIVPIHAACLDRNGRALLIAGPSGAGKSTLAVALSRQGLSLVSDDWTYVGSDGNGLTTYGLRASVKLLPDAAHHFPELNRMRPAKSLNGEMAYEVDPRHVFGCSVRFDSKPSSLLFLERLGEACCEFIPIVPSTIESFFEANSERLPSEFAPAMARRSEIIGQLARIDCCLLKTGLSPKETATAVRRRWGQN
jgi:hypothetical protein